jgi:phospholipase C
VVAIDRRRRASLGHDAISVLILRNGHCELARRAETLKNDRKSEYLVTGDNHLLMLEQGAGTRIISPADQWLPVHRRADGEHGPYCKGYYTREDIPFQFALAEAFTLCDAYDCSAMGPTWPNRMYWMTGTIDPDGLQGGPIVSNVAPVGEYTWKTYAERLEEAGISWKAYQQEDNYECNVLENFKVFQEAPKTSPLCAKGMVRGSEGHFEYDAMNDKLPAMSWIIPTSFQSEHPALHARRRSSICCQQDRRHCSEQGRMGKDAVHPQLRRERLHLRSRGPSVSSSQHTTRVCWGLSIGGGFRVPCILVSPWTARGWVSSEAFDHTSVVQLLERFTGVREPNISEWRRATFGDLTSALRLRHGKSVPPALPDTSGPLRLATYEAATLPQPVLPTTDQRLPEQEKGKRKRVSSGFTQARF